MKGPVISSVAWRESERCGKLRTVPGSLKYTKLRDSGDPYPMKEDAEDPIPKRHLQKAQLLASPVPVPLA